MQVTELWFYPIKGCAGIQTQTLAVDQAGPVLDREWMFVNPEGKFLSQREHPLLAQIKTELVGNGHKLKISFAEKKFYLITHQITGTSIPVEIWGNKLTAQLDSGPISQAASEFLGQPVRLVRYGAETKRLKPGVRPEFQPETKFTDSMPILLFCGASLADLNRKLQAQGQSPVPATRFRGNLIFSGTKAFIEDTWVRVKIGEVVFSQAKKSARCQVITIDQQTGQKTGSEPLKTLAEYRKEGTRVNFGQQFIPENAGLIKVGDSVQILD